LDENLHNHLFVIVYPLTPLKDYLHQLRSEVAIEKKLVGFTFSGHRVGDQQ